MPSVGGETRGQYLRRSEEESPATVPRAGSLESQASHPTDAGAPRRDTTPATPAGRLSSLSGAGEPRLAQSRSSGQTARVTKAVRFLPWLGWLFREPLPLPAGRDGNAGQRQERRALRRRDRRRSPKNRESLRGRIPAKIVRLSPSAPWSVACKTTRGLAERRDSECRRWGPIPGGSKVIARATRWLTRTVSGRRTRELVRSTARATASFLGRPRRRDGDDVSLGPTERETRARTRYDTAGAVTPALPPLTGEPNHEERTD